MVKNELEKQNKINQPQICFSLVILQYLPTIIYTITFPTKENNKIQNRNELKNI